MNEPAEVLVIDGDSSIRSLLEAVVHLLPRRAVTAADGRSALTLLASHPFEAVVLDLILPEVSGAEVLQFLAKRSPELLAHTIIVTTMPEKQCSKIAETRACAAVLRKPFSLGELQAALRSCCP